VFSAPHHQPLSSLTQYGGNTNDETPGRFLSEKWTCARVFRRQAVCDR
jgi:hypothetical protein